MGLGSDASNHRCSLVFEIDRSDRERLEKAYVGVVLESGMAFNIRNSFEIEGYFLIKVTPMADNLCLLEESEEGEIKDLIREGDNWWRKWFSEIRSWKTANFD